MLYESAGSAGFVDTLDGYTHLPFLSERVTFLPGEELRPENLTAIAHEYTHQLHLMGPLGLAVAYLNTATSLAKSLSEIQARALLNGLNQPEEVVRTEAALIQLNNYRALVRNYYRLASYFRWISEGLATYAQLAFRPSMFECASPLWVFVFSLVWPSIERTKEREQVAPERVEDVLKQQANHALATGTLYHLLSTPATATTPYFSGYVILRALQRKLSRVDTRASDPEVFFIFATGYFFNDSRLLDLLHHNEEDVFDKAVRTHVENTVHDLLSASPVALGAAFDRIVQYRQFNSDFNAIDFAALLREEGISLYDQGEAVRRLREKLIKFGAREAEENIVAMVEVDGRVSRDDQVYVDNAAAAIGRSLETFDILRQNFRVFKIANRKRLLLAFRIQGEYTRLVTAGENGTWWSIHSTPSDRFASLRKQIADEGLWAADLSERQVSANIVERIEQLYREANAAERPCLIDEVDIFDIGVNERVLMLSRGAYRETINKTNIESRPIHVDAIEELAPFFKRENYWERLSLDVPSGAVSNPYVPDDLEATTHSSLTTVWETVFPEADAATQEIRRFLTDKLGRAVSDPKQKELLKMLSTQAGPIEPTDANVGELNTLWHYYTGRDLVRTDTRSDGTLGYVLDV